MSDSPVKRCGIPKRSATRWWQPPSSIGRCITAMSSLSAATAIGCAKSVGAHSGDHERSIRSIMNTESGDHEHALAII
jgi:hypothetical protein